MPADRPRNTAPSVTRRALLWSAAAPVLGCIPARSETDAGTLVLSSGVDVTGMNALDVITVVPDRSLVDHIADTLTRIDRPGHLGPMLATSWSTLDERTWELKLRQGVKFHNGEAFDANATKFTYDTLIDPKVSIPTKSNFTFVSGVEVVDDYTVRIHTKEPAPLTPNLMTLLSVLPPRYIGQVGLDGYRRKPVGTGPYKFVEHVRDSDLRLEAFKDYWGGPQRYATIVYRPIREDAARVSALLTGEIDLCIDVPPELTPMIARSKSDKVKMLPSARVSVMVFSGMKPEYPTAKRDVREAISIAIDRESLNTNILGGTGAPAAWINPNTFGINPDLKPLAYDPQRARKLLADAGYPDGFDIVLDTPDGKYLKDRELAEAVAGQLAKVGIRVKVQPLEWGVFTRRMFSHQASPIAMMPWEDPRNDPDAHNRLLLTFGSTWSQIDDQPLTDLVKRIEREMDPQKRKALIFDEQNMLRTSFPTTYLVQLGGIYGVSPKLDWWEPRPDFKFWFYQNNVA